MLLYVASIDNDGAGDTTASTTLENCSFQFHVESCQTILAGSSSDVILPTCQKVVIVDDVVLAITLGRSKQY